MASIQQKCNELIKLAADISLLSNVENVNENVVNNGSTKLHININEDTHYSKYHGKIPIDFKDNYDCGELFVKVMGDTDHKGKYTWYSVIESKEKHFNLRGEIKFPLKIYDINIDINGIIKYIIKFSDIKWTENDAPSMLIESEEEHNNDEYNSDETGSDECDSDGCDRDENGCGENEMEEENTSDSDEPYDENNVSEEELIIKKDGIHVSIA
jgi:hypothetical protein